MMERELDTIEEDPIDKFVALGLPDPYPLEEIKKGIEKWEDSYEVCRNHL